VLGAGVHNIRVVMFNWCCGYSCYVRWAPPGQGFNLIPQSNLLPVAPTTTAVTVGTPSALSIGSTTKTYTWSTGNTAAGPYSAVGSLRQFGGFVASASAPFNVTPSTPLGAAVTTDKPAYNAGDVVHATGSVTLSGGNAPLANLSATI